MIAKYYKGNEYKYTYHYIVKVKPNKKYGYFETTQKIYHHEIISIQRFNDIDRVEVYNEGEKKPIEVIDMKGD